MFRRKVSPFIAKNVDLKLVIKNDKGVQVDLSLKCSEIADLALDRRILECLEGLEIVSRDEVQTMISSEKK